ncbi:hypothetical protein A2U01_0112856, partial [Trifolium medium]|nr:hypothetical protein [Trifolium medium]
MEAVKMMLEFVERSK